MFTVVTVGNAGTIWQGRYTLPLAVGILILSGYALDRSEVAPEKFWPLIHVGAVAVVVAHAWSVVAVQLHELQTSPLAGTGGGLRRRPTCPVPFAPPEGSSGWCPRFGSVPTCATT